MAWIKRNLLFTIGGVIALLLLGAASYYNLQGWNHNSAAFEKLNAIYDTLKQIGSKKPSFGDDKINNTKTAKEQEQLVRVWVDQATNYFKPIAAIPNATDVNSEAYAA